MSDALATIIVALISTIGIIIVGLMQLFKKESRANAQENREDHAIVAEQLRMIFRSVNRVDEKLDKHLDGHAEGINGKPARK